MVPARGDQKPCMVQECSGTMQFVRSSTNDARQPDGRRVSLDPADPMGWSCSSDPDHFRKGPS